jgi:hypothetical protein
LNQFDVALHCINWQGDGVEEFLVQGGAYESFHIEIGVIELTQIAISRFHCLNI